MNTRTRRQPKQVAKPVKTGGATNPDATIDRRSNEFNEMCREATSIGREIGRRTAEWLNGSWCAHSNLPVNSETKKPLLTTDEMLHAGAVTCRAWLAKHQRYLNVGTEVSSPEDTLKGFVERLLSPKVFGRKDDVGKQLAAAMFKVSLANTVPMSHEAIEDGDSHAFCSIGSPGTDAIAKLAELLLAFSSHNNQNN